MNPPEIVDPRGCYGKPADLVFLSTGGGKAGACLGLGKFTTVAPGCGIRPSRAARPVASASSCVGHQRVWRTCAWASWLVAEYPQYSLNPLRKGPESPRQGLHTVAIGAKRASGSDERGGIRYSRRSRSRRCRGHGRVLASGAHNSEERQCPGNPVSIAYAQKRGQKMAVALMTGDLCMRDARREQRFLEIGPVSAWAARSKGACRSAM